MLFVVRCCLCFGAFCVLIDVCCLVAFYSLFVNVRRCSLFVFFLSVVACCCCVLFVVCCVLCVGCSCFFVCCLLIEGCCFSVL